MKNTNRTILNVSELNAEVSIFLKQGFPLLWVGGEVSNLSRPASGHFYFSLKDSNAQIRCAMFKNRAVNLDLTVENGLKVLVRGRIGLYEARGEFQLIAEHMEDAGVGLLQKQFEMLKAKLTGKGWFDACLKRTIPTFPKKIGIISSPTSAALRDILNVLKRRSPQIPLLIYPVTVQGSEAGIQLEAAIHQANLDKCCDVLIIARGGGSIEDLAVFNDENLARALYETNIPIVTGIGHEIDFTIADFIADKRAPTPSVAAELVSPDREYLSKDLLQLKQKMIQMINAKLKYQTEKWGWLLKRLEQQQPSYHLQQQCQRLDELEVRLKRQMQYQIDKKRQGIEAIKKQLIANSPTHLINIKQQTLEQKIALLHHAIAVNLKDKQSKLTLQMAQLDAISPLKILERGYAIIRDHDKQTVIRSITQLQAGDRINTKMKDGEIVSEVL
jgi:exodeoxyribonuclease VII large subunit